MTAYNYERRILKTIELAFDVSTDNMSLADCTPSTIEKWDSLSFLNLVLALEDEFSISIDADDIAEMTEGGTKLLDIVVKSV